MTHSISPLRSGTQVSLFIFFMLLFQLNMVSAQQVTRYAGRGWSEDGTGSAATMHNPYGVAVDASGNVYVADTYNHQVRKITPTGIVTTLAGSGQPGNVNGTGLLASFNTPFAIAVDATGNIYIADYNNNCIRKVTPAGVVTTLVSSSSPWGVAVSSTGDLYISNRSGNKIMKYSSGVLSTFAGSGAVGSTDGTGIGASFNAPLGLAVDADGNVYVCDNGNNKIRKITPAGVVTTLAGTGANGAIDGAGNVATFDGPVGLSIDNAGYLYVAVSFSSKIRKVSTASGATTTFAGTGGQGSQNGPALSSTFNGPMCTAVDASGNIYVADAGNHCIRKISSGTVTTFGGSGTNGYVEGMTSSAKFNGPSGIVMDADRNLYVADLNNHVIRKITPAGMVSTFAGSGSIGTTNGTGTAAKFNYPFGIAIDGSGNLYVSDQYGHTVRKITPAGVVTTLAGSGSPGSADGTGTSASFRNPSGLAVDASGNVYVADNGNNKIRKITPAGVVTTLAGSGVAGNANGSAAVATFRSPMALAINGSGDIFVADYMNHIVRRVTPSGIVSTYAGTGILSSSNGPALSASFSYPMGLAFGTNGNLYITEASGHKVRKITTAGMVSTVAGSSSGYRDDYGTLAKFYTPIGITVDGLGNIYVADRENHCIRAIAPRAEIKISSPVVELVSGSGVYNFGNVNLMSSSSPVTLTIQNIAPAELSLVLSGSPKISLSGVDASQFSINETNTAGTIAEGSSTTFTITFTPTSAGTKTATVTVLNNDSDEDVYTFTIYGTGLKLNQSLSNFSSITKVYGDASFTLGAMATSSLPVSYSSSNPAVATVVGNTITIVSAGTTTLTASQPGNATYNAAPNLTATLTVTPAALTITANDANKMEGFGNPTFTLSYSGFVNGDDPSDLGCIPSPQSTADQLSTPGDYPVTVADCGINNTNYTYTFVGGTLTVIPKNSQTITVLSDFSKTYGDPAFTLGGTTNSALVISYTSSDPMIASISGDVVTIHRSGVVMITASQSGSSSYYAAPNVIVYLTVARAPLTVTADNQTRMEGISNPMLTVTYTGFVNGDDASDLGCTVVAQTSATISSPVNTYPITISDCGYTNTNYEYFFVNGQLEVTVNTGITGSNVTSLFSIAPNPTSEFLSVNATRDMQLVLYNTQGIKVWEQSLLMGEHSISLEGLAPGLYIVRCTDAFQQHQELRILKQ